MCNQPHTHEKLVDSVACVHANEWLTDTLGLMRLHCPHVATHIQPGQFVHMELPDLQAHILRRPFSIYDANPETGMIEILYQVVGAGTRDMWRWEREAYPKDVRMIGCIGTPWQVPAHASRVLLVGGGVGAAPLFLLYKQLVARGVFVDVVLGAATKRALVCCERYTSVCGCEPACSTDDI